MRHIETLLRCHIGLDAATIGASVIERAIRLRMKQHGLTQPDAYHQLLVTSLPELDQLIEAVVVTETWFFRDHEPFHALARLAQKNPRLKPGLPHDGRPVLGADGSPRPPVNPLRVLSLPCASGEESYSIAMTLLDAGMSEATFTIHAADISAHALARAERAVYGKNSFRGRDLEFRDRHFLPTQEGYALSPRVRHCVKYARGNILDNAFLAGSAPYDFIFCRNLLIYFDPATQVLALGKLHRLLTDDGILFVGPAELPLVVASGFVNAGLPMAFACHKASRNGKGVERQLEPGNAQPKARARSRPRLAPRPVALDALEVAQQHAKAGRFAEVVAICEAHLASRGPSAQAYYLLGLAKEASNDPTAISHYRKAIYLEPKHYEALLRITLALEKSGNVEAARIYQRRAQRAQPQS